MADDPRDILKTAGVECAALDAYQPFRNGTTISTQIARHPVVRQDKADAALVALATRLAAIVSFFDGEKDIDSAAPWALGEVRRILAEAERDV